MIGYWVIGFCFLVLAVAYLDLRCRVADIENRMAKESKFISIADNPRGVVENISYSVRHMVFNQLATDEELKKQIVESINDMQLDRR